MRGIEAAAWGTIDKWGDAEFSTEVAIRQDRHGTTVSIEQDNGECFVMIPAKELNRLIQALLAASVEIKRVRAGAKRLSEIIPRAVR